MLTELMPSPSVIARIRRCIVAIPRGRVASYGVIAARAGLPGRARLVGTVLRNTPDDVELPWHRVLRADGRFAFESGSAAFIEQAQRLRSEGVEVRNGRVDQRQFGLDDSLDALLWGPPS